MESSYSIDSIGNLARLHVRGELSAAALIELMKQIGADPRYQRGMPALADYRDASGTWDYSEIQEFRDFVMRIPGREPCRWAALVRPGSLVAVGHVLIHISEALGSTIQMRLFDDPQVALRWVRGETD